MSFIVNTVSSTGVSGSERWQKRRSTNSSPKRSREPSIACSRYFRFRVLLMFTSVERPQKSFVETT